MGVTIVIVSQSFLNAKVHFCNMGWGRKDKSDMKEIINTTNGTYCPILVLEIILVNLELRRSTGQKSRTKG